MLVLNSVSKEEHTRIGVQSLVTKSKSNIKGRKTCLQYLACKVCVCVCIYIVNSIIIFSTLSTKKEDLVCSVGCNELLKSSSPQDSHREEKSLLVSLQGSQSGTAKTH